jgi:sugar phosphate isomerase/epimerase
MEVKETTMHAVSRRQFLSRTGITLTGASYLSSEAQRLNANPLNKPIGFQAYDARKALIQDFDGAWRTLAGYGFQTADLVSFEGYGYENSPLSKMSGKQILRSMNAAGISCENCQFEYDELHDTYEKKVRFSHELGLKNIICAPAMGRTKTAGDWKWQAGHLNALGENLKHDGFQLGYHNHEIEFIAVDGEMPYEILMRETDPKLVKFQIDVGNLTFAGQDALTWLTRYPNRYFSMHAKDFAPGKMSVPVGQGIIDWKKVFEAAKAARIENYFAECSSYGARTLQGTPAAAWPSDIMDQLRLSCIFLQNLKV